MLPGMLPGMLLGRRLRETEEEGTSPGMRRRVRCPSRPRPQG